MTVTVLKLKIIFTILFLKGKLALQWLDLLFSTLKNAIKRISLDHLICLSLSVSLLLYLISQCTWDLFHLWLTFSLLSRLLYVLITSWIFHNLLLSFLSVCPVRFDSFFPFFEKKWTFFFIAYDGVPSKATFVFHRRLKLKSCINENAGPDEWKWLTWPRYDINGERCIY